MSEIGKASASNKERPFASVRWWENYVVRYFVGSVIGAAIIVFLVDPSLATLKQSVIAVEPKNVGKDLNVFCSRR